MKYRIQFLEIMELGPFVYEFSSTASLGCGTRRDRGLIIRYRLRSFIRLWLGPKYERGSDKVICLTLTDGSANIVNVRCKGMGLDTCGEIAAVVLRPLPDAGRIRIGRVA
ncbi:hypothetical protein DQG13_06940 [Paenibacillus sp. YN15]|nr:hypothetical protein DQG13_06940 [Paenibacillus sp. YN15]